MKPMKYMKKVLDLLFPPRCMVCAHILAMGKDPWMCEFCAPLFIPIEKATCIKCGIPVENVHMMCVECAGRSLTFEQNYAYFIYDDTVRRLIHNFKYTGNPQYAEGIGRLMQDRLRLDFFSSADALVYVPLHKVKEWHRGFNQARLLALEIGKLTGLPVYENLLIRKKNTKAQSKLDSRSRMNNLKDAFILNKKYKIHTQNLIIIDDIYTTGSTLSACADVLLSHGAMQVKCFTLSIAAKKEAKNN